MNCPLCGIAPEHQRGNPDACGPENYLKPGCLLTPESRRERILQTVAELRANGISDAALAPVVEFAEGLVATCGFAGCDERAGDTVVSGEIDGKVYNLRVCDQHGELISRGSLAAISIGDDFRPEVRVTASQPVELCAVCGDPVTLEERAVIAATDAVVHRSDGDGCEGRYWDPPGEAGLTEESF